MYVQDSWAHGEIPVLTYYMLLQSNPHGGDEAPDGPLAPARPAVMQAYYSDVRLLFQRARGPKPVVVHVEPDLWGYIEQANAVALGSACAQQWVSLRDSARAERDPRLPPDGWGTKHDIVYEDPSDATVRAYATRVGPVLPRVAREVRPLVRGLLRPGRGLLQKIQGNAKTWFTPADFHRHLLFGATFVKLAGVRMAAWQIPLGNTLMSAMDNTWGHYQDNRVQWLLGSSGRAHLRAYANAGSWGSSSEAAPTEPPAPATAGTTASRTQRRSTATRAPRSPPTTTAATSARRRGLTTRAGRSSSPDDHG